MFEEKEFFFRYLDKLFRNYQNIEIKEIKSFTKLREELCIGKYRIIDGLDEYLIRNFHSFYGSKHQISY